MRTAVIGVAGAAALAVVVLASDRAAETVAMAAESARATVAGVDARARKFGPEVWLTLAVVGGFLLAASVRSTERDRRRRRAFEGEIPWHSIPWDADVDGGDGGGGDGGGGDGD